MKIGSDPEFLFIKDKQVQYAHDIVKNAVRIGCDGCEEIGELRPIASIDPLKHFEDIRKLILRIDQKYNGYQIRAGSTGGMKESLGGHIHLDGKEDYCKYFDYYFSIPYLFIEEYPFNKGRRENYGSLGDCKSNRHGWEFRTPPSWLVDPFICRGTLCLAFTLENEININEELKSIDTIKKNNKYEVIDHHGDGDTKFFSKYLKDILKRIRNMEMYKDFKEEIDFIFKMIGLKRTWNEKFNIINIWKNYEEDLKQYNMDSKNFILTRKRYKESQSNLSL